MQNKQQIFTTILSVLISVFLVVTAVYAVTTVGNNVSVGGTLNVTGTTTLASNIDISAAYGYMQNGVTVLKTTSENIMVGQDAGASITTGINNALFGYQTGYSIVGGNNNTFIGDETGYSMISGSYNTFIGRKAGDAHISGNSNVFVGTYTGAITTSSSANTFIGDGAGYSHTSGSSNTFIGYMSGWGHEEGRGNVFLGVWAGSNETGSNKLYIDNSNTANPLIYGDFDTNILAINGNLGVGTSTILGDFQVLETASTTVYIGDAVHSGCLVMGDSDNGGVSYITILDGVLTATTTKPSICQ